MVQILVRSNDARIMPVLEEFARLVFEEYDRMINSFKFKMLRRAIKRIPEMMPVIVFEDRGGYIIDIPIDVPEIEMLREAIKKYTGKQLSSPKWKQNMCTKLSGYLTASGVSFESIEVIETKDEVKRDGGK